MADLMFLAEKAGLQPLYRDIWGHDHSLDQDTARHIMRYLGFPVDTPEEITETEHRLSNTSSFQSVYVLQQDKPCRLALPGATEWELQDEKGKTTSGAIRRDAAELPALPGGYYDLRVKHAAGDADILLIVAPEKCWLPECVQGGKRVWGFATQLYGLISETNWGMGDTGDLGALVKYASKHGANIIGLNPLHAMFPGDATRYSPYAPSNRNFLNILYIDIAAIDGFKTSDAVQRIWNDPDFQEKLKNAREAHNIDYQAVAALKHQFFAPLYEFFKAKAAPAAFEKFTRDGGKALHEHALFEALTEHFEEAQGHPMNWRDWPPDYHDPYSVASQQFAVHHSDRVRFYIWLQWIIDTQLAAIQKMALEQGMGIGLYCDLAVGAEMAGAEIWSDLSAYIPGVRVGAPPDEYNPSGQNWGLLAFNPHSLRRKKYGPYIKLLRANMRHCRALRIDHAFGLSRLFLIPEGKDAQHGAYMNFPFDELLALLRLESHRNQCCVIGEDLGTFPQNYKDGAAQAGLLSYKVMYFERQTDGNFQAPSHYDPLALATLTTHDLPTFAGWLQSADIDEKAKLGIYPNEHMLDTDRQNRARDIPRMEKALNHYVTEPRDATLAEKAELFLARTPCAIAMTQIEDLLGNVVQANIPTTTTERPNWRMRLPKSLDEIFADRKIKKFAVMMAEARQAALMDYPRATYRLQLHEKFTFEHAIEILPYLARLGISHVYCSPYLQARAGSMHGYDITDHNRINPELGGEGAFEKFCAALQKNGLKQILDFVPNHMGIGGSDNRWWLGMLEWGQLGPYGGYFDVNWTPRYPAEVPKVVLPVLDDHYGDVLDRGELKLIFDADQGSFNVWFHTHCFPICPRDYATICKSIRPISTYQEGQDLKAELAHRRDMYDEIRVYVDTVNADRSKLSTLLDLQCYRLAYWRVASSDINFRRFFDINDLAGMRTTEEPELFEKIHALVFRLIDEGKLAGLRIDHIDGLADPAAYCNALKQRMGAALYLVVEKILGANEALATNWRVEGTSGYDALNMISNVFVDPRAEGFMTRVYRDFAGGDQNWEDAVYDAKRLILQTTLASELQTLTLLLKDVAQSSRYTRDYPFDSLKRALRDIIGYFPIYRTYCTADHVSDGALRAIDRAVGQARKHTEMVDTTIYDFIAGLIALQDNPSSPAVLRFVTKFQQLSGPVMAKGAEDTAFYRYNRLISLNEVGASSRFGLTAKNFHQMNKARLDNNLLHSMIATATHDTKRGEDLRVRLHVIAEKPMVWRKSVFRWAQLNRACHRQVDGVTAPTPNDEYLIYQILLGSWPIELMQVPTDKNDALNNYQKRLEAYLIKVLREAKMNSSWNNPNEAYENAVIEFTREILDPGRHTPFLGEFVELVNAMSPLGIINSLSQVTLKMTLPGVPDIYQGCEFWDFNLVDPDNRRPVDYALRARLIENVRPITELLEHWQDGQVKQKLIALLLAHRKAMPDLYTWGDYEPLAATGRRADKLIAFTRSFGKQKLIVVVPVLFAGGKSSRDIARADFFKDVSLICPDGQYQSLVNGASVQGGQDLLRSADRFPVNIFSAVL